MAGKIQMKRGVQENVDKLVLAEGEFAVALDTGNVYIGTTAGKIHVNPPGGTADEAVKLQTAREFSATGDATSPAVAFNGTQNAELVLTLATMPGLTAGTYTKLTVDKKGRVTGGTQLAVSDLPGGIPTSKISGLGSAAALNTGIEAGRVVVVGANGKIDETILPDIAIGDVFEAATQAAMLALNAQKGDICIRSDEAKSYILAISPATKLENWKWLKTPDCKVLSVNGKTGAVTLSAADVGAAAASHNHDAANITSGTLPVARGGTGYTTLQDARSAMGLGNTTGAVPIANGGTGATTAAAALTALGAAAAGHTHSAVTSAANGLMIAADKAKLDGVAAGANNYVLPAGTATTLGGFKAGAGLTVNAGILSVSDIDGGTF